MEYQPIRSLGEPQSLSCINAQSMVVSALHDSDLFVRYESSGCSHYVVYIWSLKSMRFEWDTARCESLCARWRLERSNIE